MTTRITPGIATTVFPSSTVDNAKTNISPAPGIGNAQDKSLSMAGKIPRGSVPPALREFTKTLHSTSVKKNGQSPHAATGAAGKPQSRGMHHSALKKFYASVPQEGVAENAMLTAGTLASTFGIGAAMNNIARLHGSPAVKVAGALFPMPAAMASAYAEKGIRETFDVKSTQSQHSWHSAISPAAFMATNYSYALSRLPKFPPNTPAGIAATLAVSALGGAIGGGLAEAAAQLSKKNDGSSIPAASDPGNKPTTLEHGIGRMATQIPAAYLNKIAAANAAVTGGAVPRNLLLAVPATIGVPYIFRNQAASKIAENTKRQPPGQASNAEAAT